MSHTLSGTTLALVEAVPATNDQAGFEALTFVTGTCAVTTMPVVGRTWNLVPDNTLCERMEKDKKGTYKWEALTFPMNIETGDPAQDIFKDLEADDDYGSFKFTISNGDVIYLTAQVSQFNVTDGGDGNTLNMGTITLVPQSDIVYVEA